MYIIIFTYQEVVKFSQFMARSFDNSWENIYLRNEQLNIYPFYDLISFYIKNFKSLKNFKTLEIGCGYGNNIEFMSKMKHDVYGIDASKTIIKKAKERFKNKDNVKLFCQDFSKLDFKSNFFDFILNRESLTCVSKKYAIESLKQCKKVLKKNGLMYSTFVSNMNTFNGITIKDDLTYKLAGNYSNVAQLRFYNIIEIQEIFQLNKFEIIELYHHSKIDYIKKPIDCLSYWTVIAKKR